MCEQSQQTGVENCKKRWREIEGLRSRDSRSEACQGGEVGKTERGEIVLIFGVWLISLVAELRAKCQP